MGLMLRDGVGVHGLVVAELRWPDGSLFERYEEANAYTDAAAVAHAMWIANSPEPASMVPSAIGLGIGGPRITSCETTSGWTGTPSTDTTTFREGAAALTKTITASGSATVYHATVCSSTDLSAGSTAIELQMRLDYRGRCILANSELRIYTGGSSSNYFKITFAGIETVMGVAFQDGTWALPRIPTTSFTTGGGSPSWGAVTGMGLYVEANAIGNLGVWWDDVRAYPPSIDTSKSATSVPYEVTQKAVTDLVRSGYVVVASSFWGEQEAIGTWYVAGLYASTLAPYVFAISPITYYKPKNLTLAVNWTITTRGG